MGYALDFTHEALRELKRLENKEAKRIVEKLKESAKEPNAFFERLIGREEYRLRVGDYRVIANIMNQEKRIMVRSIGHRKNVYRR